MIFNASHDDIVIILAVSFGIQLGGLIFLGWVAWNVWRDTRRFARALGGLVVQESDKLRALFRDLH